ncbi:MAG TPA: ester cyclase [Solirubrobacterales bacterium]
MSRVDAHKELVRRLVDEVVNDRNPDALEEITEGEITEAAKAWIGPFREAFPDFRMEIVTLIADDERVAVHFKCSGTHRGEWRGHEPTGRRFEDIDEIYIFRVRDGKLAEAIAVEDTLNRMRQLGIS